MSEELKLSQDSSAAIENVFENYVVGKIKDELNAKSNKLNIELFGNDFSEDENLKDLVVTETEKKFKTFVNNILSNDEGNYPLIDSIETKISECSELCDDLKTQSDNNKKILLDGFSDEKTEFNKLITLSESNKKELKSILEDKFSETLNNSKTALNEISSLKNDYNDIEKAVDKRFTVCEHKLGELTIQSENDTKALTSLIESSRSETIKKIENELSSLKSVNEKDKEELTGLISRETKIFSSFEKKTEADLSDLQSDNDSLRKKLTIIFALNGVSIIGIIAMIVLFFLKF